MPDFVPLWHVGIDGCGGVAFYTGVKWWESAACPIMNAGDVIFPDGSEPAADDPLFCGCCGGPVFDLAQKDPHH